MSKTKIAAIAAGIAAVAAAGSVAFAAIPDGNGVIHACYGKPGSPKPGAIRVIDPSKSEACSSLENPLDWNQAGQAGSPGVSGYEVVTSDPSVVAAGAFGSASATCPGGKNVLGGGYGSAALLETTQSAPSGSSSWHVTAKNVGASAQGLFAYAICANVG
jgi:hypothetical protein